MTSNEEFIRRLSQDSTTNEELIRKSIDPPSLVVSKHGDAADPDAKSGPHNPGLPKLGDAVDLDVPCFAVNRGQRGGFKGVRRIEQTWRVSSVDDAIVTLASLEGSYVVRATRDRWTVDRSAAGLWVFRLPNKALIFEGANIDEVTVKDGAPVVPESVREARPVYPAPTQPLSREPTVSATGRNNQKTTSDERRVARPPRSAGESTASKMQRTPGSGHHVNWPWFILGCVFVVAGLALVFWAFALGEITPARRFLLLWILPLVSGVACGCFAGSIRITGPLGTLAVVATGGFAVWLLSFFLLVRIPVDNPNDREPFSREVYEKWKRQHPAEAQSFRDVSEAEATVWYQFFQNGVIYYVTSHNDVFILSSDGGDSRYTRVAKPPTLISHTNQYGDVNERLFDELLPKGTSGEARLSYLELLQTRRIVGGIGTVYVGEGLLETLGEPLQPERLIQNALLSVASDGTRLLINVVNAPTDEVDQENIRAVITLKSDGRFLRDVVWMQ